MRDALEASAAVRDHLEADLEVGELRSQKTRRLPRRTIRSISFPPAHTFAPNTRYPRSR
jgi:hypothetical protein